MRRTRAAAVAAALALPVLALGGCSSLKPSPPRCDCSQLFSGPVESCPAYSPDASLVLDPPGRSYTNLVFEGGGVKGVGYAGALQVLDAAGLLTGVENVAGTSAGAITTLLVALGYSPAEVTALILKLDFQRFRDGTLLANADRLLEDYGWYDGAYASCFFECVVERKLGERDATFADLHDAIEQKKPGFRTVKMFTTDLNSQQSVELSYATRPDLPLAVAARMSMSIPLFFSAVQTDGTVYVDGGVLRNYPIRAFDGGAPPEEAGTLGFFLGSLPLPKPIPNLDVYLLQLFETLLDEQVTRFCQQPDDIERSVFINPGSVTTTDFGITLAQKCALIKAGSEAMVHYLTHPPPTVCPEHVRKRPPTDG